MIQEDNRRRYDTIMVINHLSKLEAYFYNEKDNKPINIIISVVEQISNRKIDQ